MRNKAKNQNINEIKEQTIECIGKDCRVIQYEKPDIQNTTTRKIRKEMIDSYKDDIDLRYKLTNYIIMKRNRKKEVEKERKNRTAEEILKPNITKFGSKDPDDCDTTDDDFKDIGLYCPQCSEYMSNPWTLTCEHVLCQVCFVQQVRIWQNVSNVNPEMKIDCHWRMIGTKMSWKSN